MEKSGNITVVKANDNYEKVHISAIKNLSAEELGIYVKIMSFGTQWSLNIKGLTSVLDISKERVRKAIVKLEKEGYIVRKAVREDNGKMAGWDYFVYPCPVEEKDRSCAGKATTQESDNTLFQLDEKPCCRKTNNTETREDNIYRLEEITDYNKQQTNKNKENNNDKSLLKESAKELSWRNDFLTYLGIVESARKQVLSDNKSRATMEEFYPNIDLEKTINWTVESYWATEEGWKHKKKSNSKSIDMVSTLNKAIKGKYAKIFYKKTSFPKMFAQSTTSNPFEDAERLTKPKELSDGTLTNKGKRFYYTKRGDFTILPMDSPMRPSVDYEWDSLHERWVKDE